MGMPEHELEVQAQGLPYASRTSASESQEKRSEKSIHRKESSASGGVAENPVLGARKPKLPIGWRITILVLTCLASCGYLSSKFFSM